MDNRMDNSTRGFRNIDSQNSQNSQNANQNSNGNNNNRNSKNLKELKQEVANELGININKGGSLSSRDAGRVGGNMVKRMTEEYKQNAQNNSGK